MDDSYCTKLASLTLQSFVSQYTLQIFAEHCGPCEKLPLNSTFYFLTGAKQGQDRIPDLAKLVEQLPHQVMVVMRYLFQFLKV